MNESTDDEDRSVEDVVMEDMGDAKTETKQYMPGGPWYDNLSQPSWF